MRTGRRRHEPALVPPTPCRAGGGRHPGRGIKGACRSDDVPAKVRFATIAGARSAPILQAWAQAWHETCYEGPTADAGCSFGPEALQAIGQAFDAAWQEIAGNFGTDPAAIEAARLQLASALLSIASEASRNVEVLKRAALERMALDYTDRLGGPRG